MQASEARAQMEKRQSKVEVVENVLDEIYNYHQNDDGREMPETIDPDKMTFEQKRLAVEHSPVRVYMYPVGWVEIGVEMPRMVPLFGVEPRIIDTMHVCLPAPPVINGAPSRKPS